MEAQEPDTSDAVVVVTVVRTGGFAGLRREWTAAPSTDDAPRWVALIQACPWDDGTDAADPPPDGADRFTWQLDARYGGDEHRVQLPEGRLAGPWRDLVDEVQAFETERDGGGA